MDSVTHISGLEITVEGRYMRQRCAWCGEILLDRDLQTTMVAPDEDGNVPPISSWKVDSLIRIKPGNPTISSMLDDERLPSDFCGYKERGNDGSWLQGRKDDGIPHIPEGPIVRIKN